MVILSPSQTLSAIIAIKLPDPLDLSIKDLFKAIKFRLFVSNFKPRKRVAFNAKDLLPRCYLKPGPTPVTRFGILESLNTTFNECCPSSLRSDTEND